MSRLSALFLGVCASLILTSSASAVGFYMFTYENADNADLNGLDLRFDVTDGGSYADFTFYNSSTISSVIANIYFESSGAGLDLGSSWIHDESDGVRFRSGGSPHNPAPGQIPLNWGGTEARYSARNPSPHRGIGNSILPEAPEWLTIRFDYGQSDYASLVSDLGTGEFRVAQHVIGMPQSIWTATRATDPVPLPPSAWLLASGLIGWVGTRRIFKRS